jgi:Fungal Zn(2)-Cys(6) binuclear cluster domain
MASVSSRGRSPQSPYDFDSTGDTDESWQYLEYQSGSSNAASIGFLPSPASGSLNGYAIIGQVAPSPTAVSPFYLDPEQPAFPPTTFPDQSDAFTTTSTAPVTEPHFISNMQEAEFLAPQGFLFTEQQLNGMAPRRNLRPILVLTGSPTEMTLMNNFQPNVPLTGLETLDAQQTVQMDLNIPQPFQSEANVAPWNPANLKQDDPNNFIMEEFVTPSPQASSSASPIQSSPRSPHIKKENDGKSPSPIRKVKDGKVEKKKGDQAGKFVIVTPTSINAHAGKPNPFECFEALRTTQRGRKGPLANETKENALQVRRLGACFCCHARKVKCDKERPCKNCKKLTVQVPQVMCWQFQDFLTVLFPEFIHENIDGFTVNGAEQTCSVELFSGARFSAILSIKAKFFTAKTPDVLQHWHMNIGRNQIDLQSRGSAPIGIEMDSNGQRDELRKKAREYIQAIINEPGYAEQVTDSFKHTDLPKKILKIVQNFSTRSDVHSPFCPVLDRD